MNFLKNPFLMGSSGIIALGSSGFGGGINMLIREGFFDGYPSPSVPFFESSPFD